MAEGLATAADWAERVSGRVVCACAARACAANDHVARGHAASGGAASGRGRPRASDAWRRARWPRAEAFVWQTQQRQSQEGKTVRKVQGRREELASAVASCYGTQRLLSVVGNMGRALDLEDDLDPSTPPT